MTIILQGELVVAVKVEFVFKPAHPRSERIRPGFVPGDRVLPNRPAADGDSEPRLQRSPGRYLKMIRNGPALFFCSVLFLMVPFEIVFNNLDEIGLASPYVRASLLASLLVIATVSVGNVLLVEKRSQIVHRILFATALFVYVSEIATPLSMPHLETGLESPAEPWPQIGLDAALITGCAFLGMWLSLRLIHSLSACAGVVIVVVQGFLAVQAWGTFRDEVAAIEHPAPSTEFNGNVYHFVFDSFPGNWWPAVVEMLEQQGDFVDFLRFANVRSNYIATHMSLPSLTTGRVFEGGEHSLAEWLAMTSGETTLVKARNDGFVTSAYSIRGHAENRLAHFNNVTSPVTPALIGDIWFLRIVPAFLRGEVFSGGEGVFTRSAGLFGTLPVGDIRTYSSYQQFLALEADETRRRPQGEYVFAHLYPPHGPYQLLRDGSYSKRGSSFLEQTLLAVNMMSRFLHQLREEDKYDDALIIFQSDHGSGRRPPDWVSERAPIEVMPTTMMDEISHEDIGGRTGEYIELRTRALLLVKPPRVHQKEIRGIDQLAQLSDVNDLILNILEASSEEDQAAVAIRTMSRQRVSIYNGYRQKDAPDGTRVIFGKALTDGFWSVYRVDERHEWKIEGRLPVRW